MRESLFDTKQKEERQKENKGEKRGQYRCRARKYNRTNPPSRVRTISKLPVPHQPLEVLDLGIWNVQELTRHQTLLYPRDVKTGRPIPLPGGVELLDLLQILYKDVVVLGSLKGGVVHVTHRFDVIGAHSQDNAG